MAGPGRTGSDRMPRPEQPQRPDWDETRISTSLPNLDVDVRHRRSWEGDAEQIQVTLTAVPSFQAAARLAEAANPALFWMRMMQAAWAPWLALMTPPRRRD